MKKVSSSKIACMYLFAKFMGDPDLWKLRRKPTKEEIKEIKKTPWQEWERHPLPEDLFKYFKKHPKGEVVDIDLLERIRARPKGIANANKYMWLNYWGHGEGGREPISLTDEDGDGIYEIQDGNSTFENAQYSGWDKIYGIID